MDITFGQLTQEMEMAASLVTREAHVVPGGRDILGQAVLHAIGAQDRYMLAPTNELYIEKDGPKRTVTSFDLIAVADTAKSFRMEADIRHPGKIRRAFGWLVGANPADYTSNAVISITAARSRLDIVDK